MDGSGKGAISVLNSYLDQKFGRNILPSSVGETLPVPAPIIVVHDEPETRELAVSALCSAGLQAVGFDDPIEALTAVEADTRARAGHSGGLRSGQAKRRRPCPHAQA